MNPTRLAVATALLALSAACGRGSESAPPSAPSAPEPGPAREYAALPDTAICVVDRTTDRGLRELMAKEGASGNVVILFGDRIRPIEELHPVSVIAGYAGQELWFTRGAPVPLQGRSYVKYGGERRIPLDQLQQTGEYQGIPLFAAPTDPPVPPAVYAPVRVGCIFQAYVREDLYRG